MIFRKLIWSSWPFLLLTSFVSQHTAPVRIRIVLHQNVPVMIGRYTSSNNVHSVRWTWHGVLWYQGKSSKINLSLFPILSILCHLDSARLSWTEELSPPLCGRPQVSTVPSWRKAANAEELASHGWSQVYDSLASLRKSETTNCPEMLKSAEVLGLSNVWPMYPWHCAWTVWMATSCSSSVERSNLSLPKSALSVTRSRAKLLEKVLALGPLGYDSVLNCAAVATILWVAPGDDRAILL